MAVIPSYREPPPLYADEGITVGRLFAVRVIDRETGQPKTVALFAPRFTFELTIASGQASQLRALFDDAFFEDVTAKLESAEYKTSVPVSATEILTGKRPSADAKPIRLVTKMPEELAGLPFLADYMRTLPSVPVGKMKRRKKAAWWKGLRPAEMIGLTIGALGVAGMVAAISWAAYATIMGKPIGRPVHSRGMEPRKMNVSPARPNSFETDRPPSAEEWPKIIDETLRLQKGVLEIEQDYQLKQAIKARAAQADRKNSEPQETHKK